MNPFSSRPTRPTTSSVRGEAPIIANTAAAGVGGEVDHRLSGRVAAAYDNHVLARGLERLEMGRRVVETQTLEALGPVGRQAAIVGTDGENDATGTHLLAVAEHQIPQPVHLRRGDGAPSVNAGDDRAELARLQRRPLGQLRSGQAGRKAEVVLDPGAYPRLPPRGEPLDDQRAQALRGGVDGGGQ